jgi:hypothetical protein
MQGEINKAVNMRYPPLADKKISTPSYFCLWECLDSRSQLILRSHAPKRWRPPEFHFIAFNIGAINTDEGDFKNKLEMARKPADLYGRSTNENDR